MAYPTTDIFSRPDGALGVAPSGFAWESSDPLPALAVRSGLAVPAGGSTPVPSLAYIDARTSGQDGRVEVSLAGSKVGVGAAFRVRDGYNWWAVTQRAYARTYQSGTKLVQTGTETYVISSSTTAVEYEWRQNYASHSDGSWPSLHYLLGWGTSSTAPYFPSSVSHNHYHGTDPDSDLTTHYHSKSGSPYKTGATRGGETTYVYGTRAVYEEQPVYTTVTSYTVRVEIAVDGIVTALFDAPVVAPTDTPLDWFTVTLDGPAITVGVPGNAALYATSDTRWEAQTRHGIIYRQHSSTPSGVAAGALSRYAYTPTRGGMYVPHIMK